MRLFFNLIMGLVSLGLPAALPLPGAADAAAEGITFRVSAPGLDPRRTIYVTGSNLAIGGWNAQGVALVHVGDHIWERRVDLPVPGSIEYKFTLGNWDEEAADEKGQPLQNFGVIYEKPTTLFHELANWTTHHVDHLPVGQVTGRYDHYKDMKGDDILPRDVIVWLPPGYEADKAARYPVLYMHDGQNILDPKTSNGGVDWQVDESLDRMIRAGEIPPMIVVGMSSTADRTAEYSPGVKGEAYGRFIVDTVKPFVDAKYRTRPGKSDTYVAGSSMGGLITCALAYAYPDVFGAALCFSPAFRMEAYGMDFLPWFAARTKAGARPGFLYVDNGGIGLEYDLQPGIDAMLEQMKAEGRDFDFVKDKRARHFEADWAKRFPAAIRLAVAKAHKNREGK